MNELLDKNQIISIVPKDYRNANKGKVIEFQDRAYRIELFHEPDGILQNSIAEFYSLTSNGTLYFSTSISEIQDNILTINAPIKHRFLQRRAFTRIKFQQVLNIKSQNDNFTIDSLDLSAGGLKFTSKNYININSDYDLCINLINGKKMNCTLEPIRIEKADNGLYTLSGRFKNLSNLDKMNLIQFCMRRNIENLSK